MNFINNIPKLVLGDSWLEITINKNYNRSSSSYIIEEHNLLVSLTIVEVGIKVCSLAKLGTKTNSTFKQMA